MYCTEVDSSTPAGLDVSAWNTISTFATQNFLCTCELADSRTKLFLNVFLAANWTVLKIRSSRFGHVGFYDALVMPVLAFELRSETAEDISRLDRLLFDVMSGL